MRVFSVLYLFVIVFSQHTKCSIISGVVTDSVTALNVPGAHIINLNCNKSSVTDSNGVFVLEVQLNDSVLVRTINYEPKIFYIKDLSEKYKIMLRTRIYEIDEVKVGMLGSYEQFKENVLNLDLDKVEFRPYGMSKVKQNYIPIMEDEHYWDDPKNAFTSPLTYFYQKFSKEMKSVYKYHELKKQELEQLRADSKYNREIIKTITGLTDEDSVSNFMLYLNFEHNFIMNTSEYELYRIIENKYTLYKIEQKKGLKE